jgi:DNA-binding NarL/FixJ family response regulator
MRATNTAKETLTMPHSVILVGHCGVDGPRLQREISSRIPGTDVIRVNSTADLQRTLNDRADLFLVNREPVGFDEDGLEIIRDIREEHPDAKVMLVSDYPDAQEAAVREGALPGFGKSEMGSESLTDTVRQALGD